MRKVNQSLLEKDLAAGQLIRQREKHQESCRMPVKPYSAIGTNMHRALKAQLVGLEAGIIPLSY